MKQNENQTIEEEDLDVVYVNINGELGRWTSPGLHMTTRAAAASAYITNNSHTGTAYLHMALYNGSTLVSDQYVSIAPDANGRFSVIEDYYENDGDTIVVYVSSDGGQFNITVSKAQLELRSTVTDYIPYSNICPIYGHSNVAVGIHSQNYFDKNGKNCTNGYIPDAYLLSDGTVVTNSLGCAVSEYIRISPKVSDIGETVIIYPIEGHPTYGATGAVCFYDELYNYIGGENYYNQTSNIISQQFDLPINTVFIRFSTYVSSEDSTEVINNGTTNGHTANIVFPSDNKNLCNGKAYLSLGNGCIDFSEVTRPYLSQRSGDGVAFITPVSEGKTYVVSTDLSHGTVLYSVFEKFEDANDTTKILQSGTGETFTSNYDGYLVFSLATSTTSPQSWTYVQIEEGSTPTSYVPYKEFYGGAVDVVNGTLYKTMDICDLGDLQWTESSQSFRSASLSGIIKEELSGNKPNMYCSGIEISINASAGTLSLYTENDVTYIYYTPYVSTAIASVSDLVSILTGIKLIYELKTPVEYSVSEAHFNTLKGYNQVWASTNGAMHIGYWA